MAELFKDIFLIRYRNARTRIGNANHERAVRRCHLDPNLAGVRELDRVADQFNNTCEMRRSSPKTLPATLRHSDLQSEILSVARGCVLVTTA